MGNCFVLLRSMCWRDKNVETLISSGAGAIKMWKHSCLLQDSASVRQQAVPLLLELAKNANVFLITHVIDDVGEATVRGALEDAGLVGSAEGQIKPHRLVFCSTLEGKVSIVRQLEPELHIDGHPTTVSICLLRVVIPQL